MLFILNVDPHRKKLDDRVTKGIFLGYGVNTKSYVVYCPATKKVMGSRNIVFLDHKSTVSSLSGNQVVTPVQNKLDGADISGIDSEWSLDDTEVTEMNVYSIPVNGRFWWHLFFL